MQFAKSSGELIQDLLPYVDAKKSNTNFDKMLLTIYSDILKGDEFVNHKIKQNCFKTHIRGKSELIQSSLLEGKFVPVDVRAFIKKKQLNN